MTRALLVSHHGNRCGVQQFGRRLSEMLQISGKIDWHYVECDSIEEFLANAISFEPDVVVLNYHPATLAWARGADFKYGPFLCLAVYHEIYQAFADQLDARLFEYLLCPDPTLLPRNPRVVPVPRFIPRPRSPIVAQPDIFTVGSFGFATPGKGFARLCGLANAQFEFARIRINIPPHDVDALVPLSGLDALVAECRDQVTKPGLTLDITHNFMDEDALLDFLSGNTLNAFLYDDAVGRGVSSCTDYALASGRPLAISSSSMFRNLHGVNPSISVERRTLQEIAAAGMAPLRHHITRYAPEAASEAWNEAILGTLEMHRTCRSVPDGRGFNKILDDRSRSAYTHALDDLRLHASDLLTRKIERANIQQAFSLDTAERLIVRYSEPRILAVGSFEDTTVAVLRAKGFHLDEVDPNVNQMDLQAFAISIHAVAQSYDMVLCVSVLEHVEDDCRFVRTVADLLAPGGTAIFTVDFSNQYPVTNRKPALDQRLYTTSGIRDRLMSVLPDCGLLDPPTWDDAEEDFTFDGCTYAFASWVFRKFDLSTLHYAIPDLIARRGSEAPSPASYGILDALLGQGDLYDTMATLIGREDVVGTTRIFVSDGLIQGYLIYGPYCTCSPGTYRCSFLIKAASNDIPPDTIVAVFDTALDGVTQELTHSCTYSELSPGMFSLVSFEFTVPKRAPRLETRLRLVYLMELSVVASVAIRFIRPIAEVRA